MFGVLVGTSVAPLSMSDEPSPSAAGSDLLGSFATPARPVAPLAACRPDRSRHQVTIGFMGPHWHEG
jgi:hypothetical protein